MKTWRMMVILGAALLVIAALTGCISSGKTISYEGELNSTPEGAEVYDMDEEVRLGQTPLFIDGELEVERQRTKLSRFIVVVGGTVGLLWMGAGYSSWDSGSNSAIVGVPGGAALAYGSYRLSGLLHRLVITSNSTVVDDDVVVGRGFTRPSEEDFFDVVPPVRYRLSAEGYAATLVRAQAEESHLIDLSTGAAVAEESPSDGEEATSFVTAAPQPNAYAVVVGIEEYRNVAPVAGARRDAEEFGQLLTSTFGVPEGNIRLLTDGHATSTDIITELSWLRNNVPADGRVYFFFSGHGAPDVESGESNLLPYEGRPDRLDTSAVAMDEVLERLEATEAREILAFVDACFSGSGERSAMAEGTRPVVPVDDAEPLRGSRVALFSSSGPAEISGNDPDEGQGLFTRHLIDAIGAAKADIDGSGQISLAELEQYVAPRVSRDARTENRDQTPRLTVSEELGDPSEIIVLWGLARD